MQSTFSTTSPFAGRVVSEAYAEMIAEALAKTPSQAEAGVHTVSGDEAQVGFFEGLNEKESRRLSCALERNFEYVEKCDALRKEGKRIEYVLEDQASGSSGKGKKRSLAAMMMKGMARRHDRTAGIGGGPNVANTSIYVSGLPQSITWKQMESIFAAFGKIRKIKIYRNQDGTPKGDALVVYKKPGSAKTSIRKMNGFSITMEETFTLRITEANFEYKKSDEHGNEDGSFAEERELQDTDIRQELPEECKADDYPVLIVRGTLQGGDNEDDESLDALEEAILEECTKNNKVIAQVSPDHGLYRGCILVTFQKAEDALECARQFHGRPYQGRQITIRFGGNIDEKYVKRFFAPKKAKMIAKKANVIVKKPALVISKKAEIIEPAKELKPKTEGKNEDELLMDFFKSV